jgi:hypothetical protein
MVLGRMTSGPTAEEEARLKEADREAERVKAAAESAADGAKGRHALFERVRALFRRD